MNKEKNPKQVDFFAISTHFTIVYYNNINTVSNFNN